MASPASRAVSPWPFVGMSGMAAAFFLYAASGLVAPWWGVVLLLAVWLALFVTACRWWTARPRGVVVLAVVAVVGWYALVLAGDVLLDWNA